MTNPIAELAERRHRAIFDSAVDFAIVATDIDGGVTDWNSGAERIFGWSAAEMVGNPADIFFTPEDRAQGRPSYEMRQSLETGRASDERWHLRKDGSRFWASGEMMPLRGAGGEHLGYLKIVRDRTQQRLDAEQQRADAAFMRGVLASSGDCIKVLDLAGHLLFMSEGGLKAMEVQDFEAIRGCPWPEFWQGQGKVDALAALEAARDGRTGRFQGVAPTMAGHARDWDVQVTPIMGADGKPEKLLSVTRDITDQRRAEAARRESDALYKLSSSAAGTGAWEMDLKTQECVLSAEMASLLGMPRKRMVVAAANWREAILTADQPAFEQALARSMEGSPFECEFRVTLRDGIKHTLYARAAIARDAEDLPPRLNGVCVDITERRRSQEALRQSEGYVRMLLDSMSEGFCAVDRAGVVTLCNPAFMRKIGHEDDAEVLGRSFSKIVRPARPDGTPYASSECPVQICAQNGEASHMSGDLFLRADGSSFPVEYWVQPIERDGIVEGAVCTFRNITERVRAEAARRESEARFRNLADSAPSLIWMTDPDGKVTFANMHFDHMFGRDAEEFLNGAWDDVLEEPDIAEIRLAFAAARCDRRAFSTEVRVRDLDGKLRWIQCECVARLNDAGQYLGYTCCGTDVTEARVAASDLEARVEDRTAELRAALERLRAETDDRERAEAQLRQSQKMEAVGQLTGGLAHDFNNLLTGITGSLELLKTRIAQRRYDTVDRYLDAARGASDRAAALTHRLLAYSRQQTLAPTTVDANALAGNLEELIRRTVGPAIDVLTLYAPDLWMTRCDAHQLENALLNLCINARDAMPDGGKLTIETLNAELRGGIATDRDMVAADYVEIRVTDTGVGMSEETVARAFEPFFTTKPIGQGTGLGLSMIYGFARQSGGQVRIHSSLGVGTTMRIYLPRSTGALEDTTEEAAAPAAARAEAGETILVIDDEETVRVLVAEVFEDLGYRILQAETGLAGMEILRSDAHIDLLVTDVGLPGGMNGRQVADAGRAMRPGLKVLYVTGYAENAAMGGDRLEAGMHIMVKPFGLDDLAMRVRTIIEGE